MARATSTKPRRSAFDVTVRTRTGETAISEPFQVLEEFSSLLTSTNPEDVGLANGVWRVKVAKGLVTSITSVAA